jgi:WD40 repeat protein
LRTDLRGDSGGASLAFSPDGKILACVEEDGVRLWDTATGREFHRDRNKLAGQAVTFSSDGKDVLTASSSGLIQYWQVGTGKLLRQASLDRKGDKRYQSSLWYAKFSGDVSRLVVSDQIGERAVQVWDVATGKKLFQTEYKGLFGGSAALSPDNKVLIVTGYQVLARLFDTATGKELRRLEWPDSPAPVKRNGRLFAYDPIDSFTFSPSGKKLTSASKEAIQVWDVATGKLDYQVKTSRGRTAFSPDGKYLACGDRDAIRLYEAPTGKLLRSFEEHAGISHALLFSADGRTLASGEDHAVTLWDVATGKRKQAFAGHEGVVHCLAFSPDGKTLASGGSDARLFLWDLPTRKPRHSSAFDIDVLSVAFSPDGGILAAGDGWSGIATGGFDAWLHFYHNATGKLLREFPAHVNSVQRLTFSPDGKRVISSGNDARVKVWEVATGKRQSQIRGPATASHFALSPDGKSLAICWAGREVALWDARTVRKLRDFETLKKGPGSIKLLAFLPDGKTLLSRERIRGERDAKGVHFWDSETGGLLRSFTSPGEDGYYPCCTLSPDGKILAAPTVVRGRGEGGSFRLWDTTSGERIAELKAHRREVTALAFSPDGKALASGSQDTTILLWDVSQVRLRWLVDKLAAVTGGITSGIIKKLKETPEEALPLLKERLQRVADLEARALPLIADLQSDNLKVRQKASQELEKLGPGVECPLRLALEGKPNPETGKRIQTLLDKIKSKAPDTFGLSNPQNLLLVLELLEEMGSPQARKVLQELAKGRPEGLLAREAAAALKRLAKRDKIPGGMP